MASEVMRFVAGMSKQSHATVLCTIHQVSQPPTQGAVVQPAPLSLHMSLP